MLALIASLAFAAHSAEPGKVYVYDAKDADDNRALVIDVATRNVEVQDKRSAHMATPAGDLGGGYDDCSNAAFHCLTGLLEIVIPKAMSMPRWEYHGMSCEAVAQPGGDVFRIVCKSPKYRGRPTYTYSLSRGVLSIDSSPIGGARGNFALRGRYGLFSAGNSLDASVP